MANPSKARGTAWESTWTAFLREHHNPRAHRNVQMGAKDIGDVDGFYLHAAELKAEKTIRLPEYIAQANREAVNAGQPFGVAVVKRVRANVSAAYHVRDAATDVRLVNRLRDAEALAETYAPAEVWKAHYEKHGGGRQ
ncbi:hypothetical protein ACFRNT_11350 [Streptomyces sp. NPDC056697]|uniref:hypothetical protein n=1 Tax=Streptomyces TaxID=1883 RepID=UPI001FE6F474|nr:hypothetical protein [Streptomyces asiaticus]